MTPNLLAQPWLIVGGGRLGLAVALALREAGAAVQVAVRSPQRRAQLAAAAQRGWLPADLAVVADWRAALQPCVWLAVPDRALPEVAAALADACAAGEVAWPAWVIHGAGAFGADIVRPAHSRWRAACVHPLCAIADAATAPPTRPLQGALLALDAADDDLPACDALARALGGLPAVVPARERATYHAAAALVANDLAGLLHAGLGLFADVGIEPSVARAGLLHLARSSLASLQGVPETDPWLRGLTGAVARGDADTLTRHLDALGHSPAAALHRALSLYLTEALAAEQLHDPARTAALRMALISPTETEALPGTQTASGSDSDRLSSRR